MWAEAGERARIMPAHLTETSNFHTCLLDAGGAGKLRALLEPVKIFAKGTQRPVSKELSTF